VSVPARIQPRQASVLLVDDEDDLREILKDEFEYHGYRVLEAAGGRRALELVKANQATLGAVLTDVRMPGGSGTELLDNVVKCGIDVPIFLLTAFVDLSEGEAKARGASGIFSKPCDFAQIVQAVAKALTARGVEIPAQPAKPRP
jgi:CheY-like chemotaxis protein